MRKTKLLKKGDRIRLKVRTMGGWTGTATVTEDQLMPDHPVFFRKDGDAENWLNDRCCAGRHEVSVIRA